MKDRCREKVTGETKREQDGGGGSFAHTGLMLYINTLVKMVWEKIDTHLQQKNIRVSWFRRRCSEKSVRRENKAPVINLQQAFISLLKNSTDL